MDQRISMSGPDDGDDTNNQQDDEADTNNPYDDEWGKYTTPSAPHGTQRGFL